MNRNLVLVWYRQDKVDDDAVNLPENFHDSKSTLWSRIYDHTISLTDKYIVVYDSVLMTSDHWRIN